jgi:hypothetical protein
MHRTGAVSAALIFTCTATFPSGSFLSNYVHNMFMKHWMVGRAGLKLRGTATAHDMATSLPLNTFFCERNLALLFIAY